MGSIGLLSRSFLCGLNRFEVNGLPGFLELLEERRDVAGRTRGLITGEFFCVKNGGGALFEGDGQGDVPSG